MKALPYRRAAVILVVALLVTFIIPASVAYTHGFVDQVNDPTTGTSFGCGSPPLGTGSLYQSFTPGGPPPLLSGVDLRLRTGGSFPPSGFSTTIRIRSDSPTGEVLAETTTFVPGPQPVGTQLLVHFDFGPPSLHVDPGEAYVIEWVSPEAGGVILTWMGATDNPYPGGNMFGCTGIAVPDNDLNFITYDIPANSRAGDGPGQP